MAVDGAISVTAEKEQQEHAAIALNFNESQLIHVTTATTAKDAQGGLDVFTTPKTWQADYVSRSGSRRSSIRRET